MKKNITKKQLYHLYWNKKLTITEISDLINRSRYFIFTRMVKYSILRRDAFESHKDINKGCKRPDFAEYNRTHPRKGRLNGMFGKKAQWPLVKYKSIMMRSSYEIVFAQFLDLSDIKYQYESKRFDLGNSTYTPDFYIPEWNLYIEIKGFLNRLARKKMKLFKKTYPKLRLKMLRMDDLQEIGVL